MKTLIFIFSIMASTFISCSTNISEVSLNNNKNYLGNPAACYCVMLGYKYSIEKDSVGGERGYCILPNGRKVEEWAFFKGEVAQEYSYCARKGFKQIIDTISNETGFKYPCPFCVKKDSLGNIETKINMEELMKQNGDTCKTSGRKSG